MNSGRRDAEEHYAYQRITAPSMCEDLACCILADHRVKGRINDVTHKDAPTLMENSVSIEIL